MKTTVNVFGVLFFCMVCCFVFSCNKGDENTSPNARIIGRWEKVGFATDDNSNGIIDQWERNPASTTITNILEFKKDSTGKEYTTQAPDLGFRWYFGGDVSLYTIYNTGDTFTYKVLKLSGSDLHITTFSKLGLSAYYYKKK
jgi:hypothetical protein